MSEISAQILAFLRQDLALTADLSPEEELLMSGRLDSMAIMSLLSFLQSTYQIKIPEDEVLIENFETVSVIADFVTRKQQAT